MKSTGAPQKAGQFVLHVFNSDKNKLSLQNQNRILLEK